MLRVSGAQLQRPLTLDTRRPPRTARTREGAAVKIPDSDWAFADWHGAGFPRQADPAKVASKSGFDPANEYDLTYTAKDPLVPGLGYAATRDLNRSALRDPGHPVAGRIKGGLARANLSRETFCVSLSIWALIRIGRRIVWEGIIYNRVRASSL